MDLMPGEVHVGGRRPEELEVEGFDEAALLDVEVERTVSEVASHPGVRTWMRDRQRALGAAGAVVEGRDIGSVVFPDAAVKFPGGQSRRSGPPARRGTGCSRRPTSPRLRSGMLAIAKPSRWTGRPKARWCSTGRLDVEETIRAAMDVIRDRAPELLR